MSGPEQEGRGQTDYEAAAATVGGQISDEEWREPTLLERVQRTLHKYPALGPFLVLIVIFATFSLVNPDRFLQPFNISLIIAQVTVVGTLAIGQTIIILTAGVDLSVGAIAVFASIVMANLSAGGIHFVIPVVDTPVDVDVPGWAALAFGFAFGTACGLLNGLLITRLKMPPFIVTLGTLSIFFSLNLFVSQGALVRGGDMDSLLLLGGEPLSEVAESMKSASAPVIGFVVSPIGDVLGQVLDALDTRIILGSIGMLIAYALMIYVLRYTAWGRHIYAVGDDPESARLSGIRTDRLLLSVYAAAGLIYGLGAFFLLGRVQGASPQALQLANLETITAVVIGGTSLFGGRGGVLGTLFGAIIVGMAINGLTIAGFDPLWQRFAIGVLVIVAVGLDQWIRRVGK